MEPAKSSNSEGIAQIHYGLKRAEYMPVTIMPCLVTQMGDFSGSKCAKMAQLLVAPRWVFTLAA